MRNLTIFLVFVFVLFSAGCIQEVQKPVACTMEAKICPDGSSVGRVPPDCEFAPCPATTQPVCMDGETKTDVCPDGVTTYLSENCVDGEWVTVKYIRDPCTPVSDSVTDASEIDSFEECAKAGFPVMESYPRQCRADGKLFVEKI